MCSFSMKGHIKLQLRKLWMSMLLSMLGIVQTQCLHSVIDKNGVIDSAEDQYFDCKMTPTRISEHIIAAILDKRSYQAITLVWGHEGNSHSREVWIVSTMLEAIVNYARGKFIRTKAKSYHVFNLQLLENNASALCRQHVFFGSII